MMIGFVRREWENFGIVLRMIKLDGRMMTGIWGRGGLGRLGEVWGRLWEMPMLG